MFDDRQLGRYKINYEYIIQIDSDYCAILKTDMLQTESRVAYG